MDILKVWTFASAQISKEHATCALCIPYKYLANRSVIVVGVTLIWRKAEVAIHIIAMKLYWRCLNLADRRRIPKPPN